MLTVMAELWIWGVPLLCRSDLRKEGLQLQWRRGYFFVQFVVSSIILSVCSLEFHVNITMLHRTSP